MKHRWVGTLRALTPPVLLATAAAIGGLWLFREVAPRAALVAASEVAGNYLQTLGSIYAVLLAFVVYVVWTQFNETRAHVEQEAHELVDLYRTSKGLPEVVRGSVHRHLRAYVRAVLDREWPAMGHLDDATMQHAWGILDEIWDVVCRFEPQGAGPEAMYAELLSRFNDLSDIRASRVSASCTRIPLALKILLYIGAVMMVGSMYLFPLESFALHAIMTGAMAGAISHVLYVISDLDNCFQGDWQVPKTAFERVGRYLEGEGSGSSLAPASVG